MFTLSSEERRDSVSLSSSPTQLPNPGRQGLGLVVATGIKIKALQGKAKAQREVLECWPCPALFTCQTCFQGYSSLGDENLDHHTENTQRVLHIQGSNEFILSFFLSFFVVVVAVENLLYTTYGQDLWRRGNEAKLKGCLIMAWIGFLALPCGMAWTQNFIVFLPCNKIGNGRLLG